MIRTHQVRRKRSLLKLNFQMEYHLITKVKIMLKRLTKSKNLLRSIKR